MLEDLPRDAAEEEGIVYVVENIAEEYAILNSNHALAGVTLAATGKILEIEQLSKCAEELLKAEHQH